MGMCGWRLLGMQRGISGGMWLRYGTERVSGAPKQGRLCTLIRPLAQDNGCTHTLTVRWRQKNPTHTTFFPLTRTLLCKLINMACSKIFATVLTQYGMLYYIHLASMGLHSFITQNQFTYYLTFTGIGFSTGTAKTTLRFK